MIFRLMVNAFPGCEKPLRLRNKKAALGGTNLGPVTMAARVADADR
jgi:hypothetical protein